MRSGKLNLGSREHDPIPPADLCLGEAQDQISAHGVGKAIVGGRAVRKHDFGHELADVVVELREILGVAFRRIL